MGGVFLLSLSALALQMAIIKIFSVLFFYHFVFLAISISLFGYGAGGVAAHFLIKKNPLRAKAISFFSPLAFGASLILACLFISFLQRPQIPLMIRLPGAVISFLPPFLFAGMAFSAIFQTSSERFGWLYGADLFGASVGVLIPILFLPALAMKGLLLLCIFFCGLSAWLLGSGEVEGKRLWRLLLFLFLCAGGFVGGLFRLFDFQYGKDGGRLEQPDYLRWHYLGRIVVGPIRASFAGKGVSGLLWGLGRASVSKEKLVYRSISIDSGATTNMVWWDGDLKSVSFLKRDLTAFPYFLNPASSLIIGAGAGKDVLTALLFGCKKITAVEIHPGVIDAVRNNFQSFSGGLYRHERVNLVVGEGRDFAARTKEAFDLIQITLSDTEAALGEGAFSLTENHLYTLEAFRAYFQHLTPGGVLSICRWITWPPRDSLRALVLAVETLRFFGVQDFDSHLMVVTNRKLANVILKKTPFTRREMALLVQAAQEMGFEIFIPPAPGERNLYQKLYGAMKEDGLHFYQTYPFLIEPPTDDRPFFFHTARLQTLWSSFFRGGEFAFTRFEKGYLFLLFTLGLGAGLTALIFLLAVKTMQGKSSFSLLYFAALGVGYMLAEIGLIGKLSVLLGHPVRAAAAVLAGLLVFSGFGSLCSDRLQRFARSLPLAAGALICLLGVAFPFLIPRALELPAMFRWILTVGVLAPAGFFMGLLFPLGIKRIRLFSPSSVSWAYGINATASVLGSSAAMGLALSHGFTIVLLACGLVYMAAALVPFRR